MNNLVERIGELLAKLQSSDYLEREEAVIELGNYDTDEAVAGLVIAIEDPNPGIRELASEHLSQMKGDTAPKLLIHFLGNDDIIARNLAAEILVKIGSKSVPYLIEQINVDDYDIRKFIVDTLGLIKDENSIDALCQKLWDENINVVCSAAEALGEVGSPAAIDALVAVFEKIEDARPQALEALGKIGDTRALEHLYRFIKTDDPIIQYAGIEAIGKIGNSSSMTVLSKYLNNEDESVSELALTAIINISNRTEGNIDFDLPLDKFSKFLFNGVKEKDPEITDFTISSLKTWFGHDVIYNLIDVLDAVDEENQKLIIEILGQVGGTASTMLINKFSESSVETKKIILEIIKQFIDENIAGKLLDFVDDEDPIIRQKLAHMIGFSNLSEALPVLKKMTEDEVGHVRSAAYAALGWLCTEDEVDFFVKGLDDQYQDVREAAAGAMIIIGTEAIVKKFRDLLFDENVEKQRISALSLGMIGDSSVVEPLIEAINHPDEKIRRSAISSLARIGDEKAIESIMVALNDESKAVRKSAINALVVLQGQECVPKIKFLLDDEDIWIRYHTINTIGNFGNNKFSEYILPYLNEEQDVIRIAAMKALSKMGCREAISTIGQFTNDSNEDIVSVAQQAISTLDGEK